MDWLHDQAWQGISAILALISILVTLVLAPEARQWVGAHRSRIAAMGGALLLLALVGFVGLSGRGAATSSTTPPTASVSVLAPTKIIAIPPYPVCLLIGEW